MKQLLLCVTYTAKPGMREKFVEEVITHGLVDVIKKEDGCLNYDYYYSSAENEILLIEHWTTPEKQMLHMMQPHMRELKKIKENYILKTDIKKYYKTL